MSQRPNQKIKLNDLGLIPAPLVGYASEKLHDKLKKLGIKGVIISHNLKPGMSVKDPEQFDVELFSTDVLQEVRDLQAQIDALTLKNGKQEKRLNFLEKYYEKHSNND